MRWGCSGSEQRGSRLMRTSLHLAAVALVGCTSVLAQPVILSPPQHSTNVVGSTANFSVVATGAPPLQYQWRFGANFAGFGPLFGETNASLLLTNVKLGGGHCDVIVYNSEGSVTSVYARLTVRLAPVFNVHPLSQTVTQGARVTLFAESKSSGATNYQWQWNGRSISGQRSNEMSIGNVRLSDEGEYACVVFDGFARATSAVARLTVIPLAGVTKS